MDRSIVFIIIFWEDQIYKSKAFKYLLNHNIIIFKKFFFCKKNIFIFAHLKNVEERCIYCENSSVGRARPCQGRGRGFESRFSLRIARVVELVDTPDLKSCGHFARAGSSPASSTWKRSFPLWEKTFFRFRCWLEYAIATQSFGNY